MTEWTTSNERPVVVSDSVITLSRIVVNVAKTITGPTVVTKCVVGVSGENNDSD